MVRAVHLVRFTYSRAGTPVIWMLSIFLFRSKRTSLRFGQESTVRLMIGP